MNDALNDTRIPVAARMALANAALAYANAVVDGDPTNILCLRVNVNRAASDVRICMQAADLGMVEGE